MSAVGSRPPAAWPRGSDGAATPMRRGRGWWLVVGVVVLWCVLMSPAVLAQGGYVVADWEPVTGSGDLSGYRVFLATDPSVFNLTPQQARSQAVTRVVTGGGTETTFTGLDPSRMYYVGVTSYDSSGNESGFSNVSSTEPCMVSSTGSVSLEWDEGSGEVSGYRVYVSEEAGVFSGSPREARRRARVREEPAGSLGARVGGLEAGRTYHVAVTTLDASGQESGFSEVTTTLAGVLPTLCSVYPDEVRQGSTLEVSAYGGNFDSGAGVDLGPGVSVSGVNGSGAPERLRLTLQVEALAPVDTRDVTVTNTDGSTTTGLDLFGVTLDVGRADVNGSNRIDGGDMVRVAAAFTARVGEARYGTGVDLNVDGVVDGTDLSLLIVHFGMLGPY